MAKMLTVLQLIMHLFYGMGGMFFHTKIKGHSPQNPATQYFVTRWFKRSCQLVGLSVKQYGEPVSDPVLFTANHVSWLDIPLVASVSNPRFLSKSEVRKWPIIGWLAEKTNTVFIVRGQRSASEAASAAIVDGLQAHDQILIFPEGTTTDGRVVSQLYPRLLGAAIAANTPVQPIVIHYTDDNSDAEQSERVPYINQQTLLSNLWSVLGCKNLTAHVYFLPPIASEGMARKALATTLHKDMQAALEASQAKHAIS